jgi:sugar-specific transcriptional regulator TrmB/DNA-binding CsgD family transcriptional regulator
MSLTKAGIQAVRPTGKTRRLFDGGGLYLELSPVGGKWWRFRYRFEGKEKRLSFGTYPSTSLKGARVQRDAAQELLQAGVDPGAQRKAQKIVAGEQSAKLFARGSAVPNSSRYGAANSRPLEVLGIDDLEERVYRALLIHHLTTATEVARALAMPLRRVQRLLDSIENKGLATHSPERPRRYIATSPEFAVAALASQRQADIQRALLIIPELKEQAASVMAPNKGEHVVEVINSRAALGQVFAQLMQTARSEIFGFQRAPILFADSHPLEIHPAVRIRSISDNSYLELPVALDRLQRAISSGEQARTFPTLPVKMMISDRRTGLIFNAEDTDGPLLLVRSSPLLDSLCVLFESLWERSTPLLFTRTGKLRPGNAGLRLSEAAKQVIPLLASGLSDKAIAHQAGISYTTLTRRVTELMKALDVRTRFQLGWRAALDAFPHGVEQVSSETSLPGGERNRQA